MLNRNKLLEQSLTGQLDKRKIKQQNMKRWKQFLWSGSDKNGHLTVDGPILERKADEIEY
jgi:hypothetical protein